jgi:hypothetical protein
MKLGLARGLAQGSGSMIARLCLPLGWVLATAGYYGPWIAHETAALTLTGSDMGEFVKFLPGVSDGSLQVMRQLFYLPPVAVVLSVALLVGNRSLNYSLLLRVVALVLSLALSVQLLPPAWSPASVMTAEFRLQPIALGLCWLALAGFWLLGRLPLRMTALVSSALTVLAGALSAWQMLAVKSAIDTVYGTPPSVGWGCFVCLVGLTVLTAAGIALALLAPPHHTTTRHK